MIYCAPIVVKGNDVTNYNYYMSIGTYFGSSATIELQDSITHDNLVLDSGQLIDVGKWHYIAGVRHDSTISLFIDGVLDTSDVYSSNPLWVNDLPLTIGSYPYSNPWYFRGKIDEVRIYNRALTQTEILALSLRCGDANGDMVINSGDAVFLINHIFKSGPAPDPLEAGDANCNGSINSGDAIYLINYVFRNGPVPCCPE